MTQQPVVPPPAKPDDTQLAANAYLKRIEEHLQSIRRMLTFFTGLTIIVLIIWFLGLFVPLFGP